jgi:hypothetical protein
MNAYRHIQVVRMAHLASLEDTPTTTGVPTIRNSPSPSSILPIPQHVRIENGRVDGKSREASNDSESGDDDANAEAHSYIDSCWACGSDLWVLSTLPNFFFSNRVILITTTVQHHWSPTYRVSRLSNAKLKDW